MTEKKSVAPVDLDADETTEVATTGDNAVAETGKTMALGEVSGDIGDRKSVV